MNHYSRVTFVDYDSRREPKTALYCCMCQRDLDPRKQWRRVFLTDGMLAVHPADVARRIRLDSDFGWRPIGNDCAKELGFEWTATTLEAAVIDTPDLPRCEHGNALRDGDGEQLAPSCGCTC